MDAGLTRWTRGGVTLCGKYRGRVRFGFTERTGGVSDQPFSSLNLGAHTGDDPASVAENRRRALRALGADGIGIDPLVPTQVHGSRVVSVASADPAELVGIRAEIDRGADAIVCTAERVPVMLCFADCVPVVLTCGPAFAIVHSGWRGTLARVCASALAVLSASAEAPASAAHAFIGPHILGDEYEVSQDLHRLFEREFAMMDRTAPRLLDLGELIVQTLEEAGVPPCQIHDPKLSTVRLNNRYFSYRREDGRCGRHAAIAVMLP